MTAYRQKRFAKNFEGRRSGGELLRGNRCNPIDSSALRCENANLAFLKDELGGSVLQPLGVAAEARE